MLRLTLMSGAVPAGLATGLAAWLLAGGSSAKLEAADELQARFLALRAPRIAARANLVSASDLLSTPIFALTTGPGALREPGIRLDGVSISSRRTAALVSIDGRLAEWWRVGESREGVTLTDLNASGASFETALGTKGLALGEQSAASAPAASAPPAAQAVVDQMPPGFRGPPPPASAPAMR